MAIIKRKTRNPYQITGESYTIKALYDWGYGVELLHAPVQNASITATIDSLPVALVTRTPNVGEIRIEFINENEIGFVECNSGDNGKTLIIDYFGQGSLITGDVLSGLLNPESPESPSIPQWNQATLLNNWKVFDSEHPTASYYIDVDGVVHLRGVLKNTNVTAWPSTIFVLPTGFRPPKREIFANVFGFTSSGLFEVNRIDVLATGSVFIYTGKTEYVSLCGITFRTF